MRMMPTCAERISTSPQPHGRGPLCHIRRLWAAVGWICPTPGGPNTARRRLARSRDCFMLRRRLSSILPEQRRLDCM
jgi:hypothetical protein